MSTDNRQLRIPRRKILIISPWEPHWSLESSASVHDDFHFADKLIRSGFDVHFLRPRGEIPVPDTDHLFTHTYTNFFARTFGWPTAAKRLLWPFLIGSIVVPRAVAVARAVKPDFILGHTHHAALASYVAGELVRVPAGLKLFGVMDLVHSEWPWWKYYYKNLEQVLALKIPQDILIVLDDGTRGKEAAMRHGVPEDKIRFLPNGINVEWMDGHFDRRALRQRLDIPDDAVVVLFLARFVGSKRPDTVIRAIPEVLTQTQSVVRFLFVGEGEELPACKRMARELEVEETTRFIGGVPHAEVPEIMAVSDLFVSVSRLTNMSIPTCEALVCGLPVVAFDVGTTSDVVKPGKTGLLVPDGNVEKLAAAIASLVDDEPRRARMSEAARSFAREHFAGWEARTEMELDIIKDVIGRQA